MSAPFVVEPADWDAVGPELAAVRIAVFVVEQRVPEDLEWDGLDAQCFHVVARDGGGGAIGTGRLTPQGRIGRMAVLAGWRGRGVGSALLGALVGEARRRRMPSLTLHAQIRAVRFYERVGFETHGDVFDEADIPHQEMRLGLGESPR